MDGMKMIYARTVAPDIVIVGNLVSIVVSRTD